jgi:hypothetical protein
VAHDHHFLERLDRVTREQTELALALYRDHELVQFLVGRAELAPSEPRFAVSLDDADAGPFLVVGVDGHFVTCLARGMRPHGLPVRTRGWLDGIAEEFDRLRARARHAKRAVGDDAGLAAMFRSIFARAAALPREDFRALASVMPLLGGALLQPLQGALDKVSRWGETLAFMRGARGAPDRALIEKYWELAWGASNILLLFGAGGETLTNAFLIEFSKNVGSPSATLVATGITAIALRGAHFAAVLGRDASDLYARLLATREQPDELVDATVGLVALAARYPRDGRARAALEHARKEGDETPRGALARAALRAFEEPADYIALGREQGVRLSTLLPAGHPFAFAKPADVPEPLARTLCLTPTTPCLRAPDAIGTLFTLAIHAGRIDTDELFFPEDLCRQLRAPGPDELFTIVTRALRMEPSQPARATPRVGRNDPCPCGSGKKYKKCHGA